MVSYWRKHFLGCELMLGLGASFVFAAWVEWAHGEATANVALDAAGIRLVASITIEAATELGLEVGSQVTAIVKASDVILAVAD